MDRNAGLQSVVPGTALYGIDAALAKAEEQIRVAESHIDIGGAQLWTEKEQRTLQQTINRAVAALDEARTQIDNTRRKRQRGRYDSETITGADCPAGSAPGREQNGGEGVSDHLSGR